MTDHLIDTIALVKYLEDDLPRRSDAIFKDAERGHGRLILPQVALAEFVYVAMHGRAQSTLDEATTDEIVQHVLGSDFIVVSPMPTEAWDWLLRVRIPELYDRMIAAEALARHVPLISSDPTFGKVKGLQTIWK